MSEIIRNVRERGRDGDRHGEPVAEIRPVEPTLGETWAGGWQSASGRASFSGFRAHRVAWN